MIQQDPNNFWEQLERLEKLIRASELKAGIIFSFHSLILGLFIDKLDFFDGILKGNILFYVLIVIWITFVLISIFFSFKCFRPRIEKKFKKNVFFFRDAAYSFGDIDEYSKKLTKVCTDENELFTQLSHQVYIESKIIDQKFKSVHNSIKFFGLSFIVLILIFALLVIKI